MSKNREMARNCEFSITKSTFGLNIVIGAKMGIETAEELIEVISNTRNRRSDDMDAFLEYLTEVTASAKAML